MQDKEYTPILIRTKLHRPPLPVCMVKRPRLTGWLPAPQDRSTWSCVSTGPNKPPSMAPGRRRRSSRATENVLENFLKEKKWLP
jgi:hypothetical protein